MSIAELQEVVVALGLEKFRAKQLYGWLYRRNCFDFAAMANLGKANTVALEKICTVLPSQLNILQEQRSEDALTEKLLIELEDGNTIETVLMRHDYGCSVCVSSQVGCAMRCRFCASGLNGVLRNLSVAEIVAQVAVFNQRLAAEGKRVSRLVVMGSGEPLLNFDNVIAALEFMHQPLVYGLSYRNMTLSTCGILPGIERLTDLGLPINLAISLHSVREEMRSHLMPINQVYAFPKVIAAAEAYAEKSGRQVTYEYILLKNLNDSESDALLLADYLKRKHATVNLIPANPVPEQGFASPDEARVQRFVAVLNKRKINVTVRREMGKDINAACGQLRANFARVSQEAKGSTRDARCK